MVGTAHPTGLSSPQGVALGGYVTPFQGWVPISGAGEVAITVGV